MDVFDMMDKAPKEEMKNKDWEEILTVELNKFYIICLTTETMLANYVPSFIFD